MRLSAATGLMVSHIRNTYSFAAERMLHPEHGDAMRAVGLDAHAEPAEAVYYARVIDARPCTLAPRDFRTWSQGADPCRRLPQTCLEER
jgi:hypothetical protein